MNWLDRLRDVRDGKFTPDENRHRRGLCWVVVTSGATNCQSHLMCDWIERHHPDLCKDWWGAGDLWEGGRGQWRRRVAGELVAWASVVLARIGKREQAVYSEAADILRADRLTYSCNAVQLAGDKYGIDLLDRYVKWGTTLTGHLGRQWLHDGLGNDPSKVDEDDYRPLRVAMLQALADGRPHAAVRAYWAVGGGW